MRFCPQCGVLMTLRSENGKPTWVCPSCGYKEDSSQASQISLTTIKHRIQHSERDRIVVIKQKVEVLPKTRAVCPKCGYQEAYYWVVQTRRADEPPTRFFRCVRCGHVWREYD